MKVYDTLTALKREFIPLGSTVNIYVCGLTPKNKPHLGHAKLFVTADLWRRYLEYLGLQVRYAQNVTDVDDKIIARAIVEGSTPAAVAAKYTAAYFAAVDAFNCRPAHVYPRATAAIPGIITMTEGLINTGYAYEVEGNVFYRVGRFPTYGRLSKRQHDDNEQGAGLRARNRTVDATGAPVIGEATPDAEAIDTGEPQLGKEDPRDFALWKRAKPGEPQWESPWGAGRPGWHIECSTMILEQLGEQIDIHGGGRELIFPHHENEIAQSEAYTGKSPFARYWLHIGVLLAGNEKMSHSLGNFTTIESVLERFDPMAIRLYLLSQHYRTPVSYTEDALATVAQGWERLKGSYRNLTIVQQWEPVRAMQAATVVDLALFPDQPSRDLFMQIERSQSEFLAGMDDDFNTAQAIAALHGLARQINAFKDTLTNAEQITPATVGLLEMARRAFASMLQVLGLREPATETNTPDDARLAAEVAALIAQRQAFRAARDWASADMVRARIDALGVVIEDHPQGTIWRRKE